MLYILGSHHVNRGKIHKNIRGLCSYNLIIPSASNLDSSLTGTRCSTWTRIRTHTHLQQTKHGFVWRLLPPPRPVTELDLHRRKSSNTCFNYCTYVHQSKIPYTRSRCRGQLTIVQFLSYLLRICTPDDGSLESKHVAPCLLLSKIK